jgi:response regulator RpfG family c-di-GMP phosphodiesterase
VTAPAALPRVLFVDDESNLLDAMRRQLRREFSVETTVGAANGLAALGWKGPFDVVVSDYLMPGINGAEFLSTVRKMSPLSTRMLLTGHADLSAAANTVNEGGIFRMLIKPVNFETMVQALHDCVEQHQLATAERDLLEQTLNGSIKALADVLALASPAGFGRATRMRQTTSRLLVKLQITERWQFEVAATVSQLGVVTLPPRLVERLRAGDELSTAEQDMVDAVPVTTHRLLSAIPRMTPIIDAIRYSRKSFDGSGPPNDGTEGEYIPLGGRLLRLVEDYELFAAQEGSGTEAYARMRPRAGSAYDPTLLEALGAVVADLDAATKRPCALADLEPGMILAANVRSEAGHILVTSGQEVSPSMITRLANFRHTEDPVAEPLMILHSPAE